MSAPEATQYAIASVPLWVAPAILAIDAFVAASAPKGAARRVGLVGAGLAFASLLPSAPDALSGHPVISIASRLGRVGSLDLAIGSVLDAFSLVAVVAVLAVHGLVVSGRDVTRRAVVRSSAVAAGAALAVMADGLPAWALGAGVALVTGALATARSWEHVRTRFGSAAIALVSVTLAFAYLAWSLGGQWLDGNRYLSDWGARFTVPREAASAGSVPSLARDPHAMGSITMVTHPGARVYVGVADELGLGQREPLAVAPFTRVALPAGLQNIAIVPGDAAIIGGEGLEAALLDAVPIKPGEDTVIGVSGATVTFSELAAQVEPARLGARRLGEGRAATMFTALFGLGALFFALFVGHKRAVADRADESATDALAALPMAALAFRLSAVLAVGEAALVVVAALGVGYALHVAYETWLRPIDGADRPRAALAAGLALVPALAVTGVALAAPVAVLAASVGGAMATRSLGGRK